MRAKYHRAWNLGLPAFGSASERQLYAVAECPLSDLSADLMAIITW